MSYPTRRKPKVNVLLAYGLCALGLFGICGIHRLYLGRYVSGILYFFTLGFFGIGQIIDLALIPSMAEERNRYLREATRTDDTGELVEIDRKMLNYLSGFASGNEQKLSQSSMQKLLNCAAESNGVLSVAQAVRSTGLDPNQVKELLNEAMRQDLAHVGNDPETGAVRYYFDL
jgi:TM2 domain-containing membrane protein YozV